MDRILEKRWLGMLLGALGLVAFGIMAIRGDQFATWMLLLFSLVWLGLCTYNGLGWTSSNEGWHRALDEWKEYQELAHDLTSLLAEATDRLSTYDRETADEIRDRAKTIIVLRSQNTMERGKDRS